jgi:hypothetical protein
MPYENARGYFNSPQIEAASAQRCGLVRAAVDENPFSSMTPSSVAHRSDGHGWMVRPLRSVGTVWESHLLREVIKQRGDGVANASRHR